MIDITALTGLHLFATALPCAAAATFARNRGVAGALTLIAIAVAAGGVFAYATFWAFFAARELGIALSVAVPLASLTYMARFMPDLRSPEEPLRRLGQPLALWIFGSIFILALGFLHGGSEAAVGMSSTRFGAQLPSDNDIPRFFALQFFHGAPLNPPSPFPGDWLSSDRPPLQIGYVLTQMGLGIGPDGLSYQVHAVILQQTWIVGLWALLTAGGLSSRTRALALIAALVTDITIVHGFFVWPKLLPATFLLLALALVISPQWRKHHRDSRMAVLVATLLGLALLGHGGSVFGILPILLLAAFRGIPNLGWIGIAFLTGLLFVGTWTVYQRAVDPPGDRLVKWHLGGQVEVTEKSPIPAIIEGYREVGVGGAIDNKLDNLDVVIGVSWVRQLVPELSNAVSAGNARAAIEQIRSIRFFSTLPAMGFLLLAPIIMLFGIGKRRPQLARNEWRFALTCLGLALIGTLIWTLLVFGGPFAGTSIHVGSLILPLLMIAGAVAGMMSVAPRLGIAVVLINAFTVLALYIPSFTPPEGTSYSPIAAILVVAGLAGFVASALFIGPRGLQDSGPPAVTLD